jgi:hypothetical protein
MPVGRRDLLKLAAASLATALGVPLAGCPHTQNGTRAAARLREIAMNTRPLMVARIVAAPPQTLGAGPRGTRLTFPIKLFTALAQWTVAPDVRALRRTLLEILSALG